MARWTYGQFCLYFTETWTVLIQYTVLYSLMSCKQRGEEKEKKRMAVISEYQMIMCRSFTLKTLEVICKGFYLQYRLLAPSFTEAFEFRHLIFICYIFMNQKALFGDKGLSHFRSQLHDISKHQSYSPPAWHITTQRSHKCPFGIIREEGLLKTWSRAFLNVAWLIDLFSSSGNSKTSTNSSWIRAIAMIWPKSIVSKG